MVNLQTPASTSELIQTALNYTNANPRPARQPKKDKDPKLMDLLYRSFQAKLARGDFNNNNNNNNQKQQQLQHHQQQHQHSTDKQATHSKAPPTVTHFGPAKMTQKMSAAFFSPQHQQLQQLQQHQQQQQFLHNGHELQCSNVSVGLPSLSQPPPVITTSPFASAGDILVNSNNSTAMQNFSNLANAQVAFLQQQQQQQQGILSLGQHPFYSTPAFQASSPAPLFTLPPQFMWPGQLGIVPTTAAGSYATAYPPPPQAALPTAGSLFASPETFAFLQNNPYLQQATPSVGMKRSLIGDYGDVDDSKRLRLNF